ncbi:MAG TPA: hypothetical protein VHL98_11210 [Microvirga sp.]|jgi:hypothetical protein|nr:hypothetical protein [Microvirga sp.]
MNWQSLAQSLAPYAPTLGKILGGAIPFPGGALLGEWAGTYLARQLGTAPTPEAIAGAVLTPTGDVRPEAVAAIQSVESEAAARWDAMAREAEANAADRSAQSASINETMRAEVTAGVSWYHWRHLIGYATLLWAIAVLPPFVLHLWKADATALQVVTAALTSSIPFFAILAGLNGYIAGDTSKFKETLATGVPRQGVVAAVAAKVTGKR